MKALRVEWPIRRNEVLGALALDFAFFRVVNTNPSTSCSLGAQTFLLNEHPAQYRSYLGTSISSKSAGLRLGY